MKLRHAGWLLMIVVILVDSRAEAQWGHLKGQVVLAGDVPVIKPLYAKGQAPKDNEVCGLQDIPDESLLIDPKTRGIANVFVWLAKKPDKINPALVKPPAAVADFDNVKCLFVPRVMVLRAGQQVKLLNDDAIPHNTNFSPLKGQAFNVAMAPKDRKGDLKEIKIAERLPTSVACNVHPWMRAYWLILDHPYAAITDQEGRFEIRDLPPGDHEFKVWHENSGYAYTDPKDPKKGLLVNIEAGQTREAPAMSVPVQKLLPK